MSRREIPKRQRRHGSAYVEALIVMGLFAFLWASGLALGRLYTAKLASVYQARTSAWLSTRAAADGCDAPRDLLGRTLDALYQSPDPAHAHALLDAATQLRTRGPTRTSVQPTGPLSVLTGSEGAHTVETSTRFACNEPVQPDRFAAKHLTAQRWLSELLRKGQP